MELYFLDEVAPARAGFLEVASLLPNGAQKAAGEAVYSLLDLGGGRIAVGLLGTAGRSRFGIAQVAASGDLRALGATKECKMRPAYPELKHAERNSISALAWCGAPGSELVQRFLGCGDGQVWNVAVCFIESDRYEPSDPVLVGRLHAPVRAIASSVSHEGSNEQRRVFAGGSDGSLIAFQALSQTAWATLWALNELGGAIARIFVIEHPPVGENRTAETRSDSDGKREEMVLAVTQQGMAVLIDNRATCELRRSGDRDKLRRIRVPGERLGRFTLESPVLAAASLPLESSAEAQRASAGVARLAVVTNTGNIRLLRLYYPKFTASRKKKFEELCSEWLHHMRGPRDAEIQGYLLRRAETTLAAGPSLPSFLVRWILPYSVLTKSWSDRSKDEGPGEALGPASQWLPRHLRPLLDLEAAWSQPAEQMTGKLAAALMAARGVEDRRLFKEILEAVLTRANHWLFYEARKAADGNDIPFARTFLVMLSDLETVMGAWVGLPGGVDARMRISIVKSLLDGDTLWSLARVCRRGPLGMGDDLASQAMHARIRLIRDCLGQGNRLLAEETLRAANLALMRLCRRLVRRKDEDWRDELGDHQLPWESLPGFFEAVGDFAARSAHPHGSLGEVATHEICRTYSLGMLVCPAGVVRLASWMAETDPPSDMGKRVLEQLGVLSELLDMQLPQTHQLLLRTALGTEVGSYKNLLFHEWSEETLAGRDIGIENERIILARKPFDQIVLWLRSLARQLLDEAGEVDLSSVPKLLRDIAGSSQPIRHSRQFWQKALQSLIERIEQYPDLIDTQPASGPSLAPGTLALQPAAAGAWVNPVRPALVLFSRDLAEWCREQRDRIQKLCGEYELFNPIASMYDEALGLVERASVRFPHGAAVQKNLVLGVLDHGLLELLDEHLLEVWEIAQALDPIRTWEHAGTSHSRIAAGTAGRFADYLLVRAVKAEAIPKNLRSLQGLLSFSSNTKAETDVPDSSASLLHLLEEFKKRESWCVLNGSAWDRIPLLPRPYHFLRLTLGELAQNDRAHGLRSRPELLRGLGENSWLPLVYEGDDGWPRFQFSYPPDDDQRVSETVEQSRNCQTMVKARREPRLPSHGSGLYLANLAAASVGWKLDIDAHGNGTLVFKLKRVAEERD